MYQHIKLRTIYCIYKLIYKLIYLFVFKQSSLLKYIYYYFFRHNLENDSYMTCTDLYTNTHTHMYEACTEHVDTYKQTNAHKRWRVRTDRQIHEGK